MSADLSSIEAWAGALLAKLSPGQRRVVGRKIAIDLRRSRAQGIAEQHAPSGETFVARKQRKEFRNKSGRIKRQKAAMFNKLRTTKYLQIEVNENQIAIGFFGRVARLARVHQEGLEDKVAPTGPKYKYPARPLLGFSERDRIIVRDAIVRHMIGT